MTAAVLQNVVAAVGGLPSIEFSSVAPSIILALGGVLLLTVVSVTKDKLPVWFPAVWTISAAVAALCTVFRLWIRVGKWGNLSLISGAVGLDRFSLFVIGTLCVSVVMGALLLEGYLRREDLDGPEWYVLLLLAAAGGTTMAAANDLIVLFIGLEILSIAVYILSAMHRRRMSSLESGLKYFIHGAFASAFLLYGIAMVYGATGSTNLARISTFLADNVITQNGLMLGGIALMLVGFAFKVAAVPFHQWAPDVYQGAPTPVSAFMAAAVKTAAFAGMIRVFVLALGPTYRDEWRPMVLALAVLSLLVGSVMALVQTNVKRMLAYSSIGHAGFILVAVHSSTAMGTSAALFYLLSYTFMVMGSFGVVAVVGRKGDGHHQLSDYRGLGRIRPGLALAFTIFLLAQAGVPLTAGFLSKFYVIRSAIDSGDTALGVVAMLAAVIAAFLYLRVIVAMYFEGEPGDEVAPVKVPAAVSVAIGIALAGTLLLGIVPDPVTHAANEATAELVAPRR
jgi:NADH-quinone oxidoreductase subunit N